MSIQLQKPDYIVIYVSDMERSTAFYRDELGRYLQEILLDPRTLGRSFLRKPAIEELVRGHVGGYRNHTSEIHTLLTIELVQRQLLDRH